MRPPHFICVGDRRRPVVAAGAGLTIIVTFTSISSVRPIAVRY